MTGIDFQLCIARKFKAIGMGLIYWNHSAKHLRQARANNIVQDNKDLASPALAPGYFHKTLQAIGRHLHHCVVVLLTKTNIHSEIKRLII